jgi:hypothetical protein
MLTITAKDWRKERINDCAGRYELKSIIDPDMYGSIVGDVTRYMKPDPHSNKEGWYHIHSTYYDSPELTAYQAKLDGLSKRSKLRLRTYTDPFYPTISSNAHCEIKEKDGAITYKRRLMLPVRTAQKLCAGNSVGELHNLADSAVAKEICERVNKEKLNPVCSVEYLRQAFVGGGYYPDLRITFDTDLQGCKFGGTPQQLIPDENIVFELKFNRHVPEWVVELITKYNCFACSSSKYCLAMETDMHDIAKRILRG